MPMNGIKYIKVKYILEEEIYGFKIGQIYEAIKCKDKLGGKEMVGIANMDGDEEEYAYPASWFEIVND